MSIISPPSAADIYNAVCLNSVALLDAYVKATNVDLNMDLSSALPKYEDILTIENGRVEAIEDGCFIMGLPQYAQPQENAFTTALHLAIVCCYQYSEDEGAQPRLDMLKFLLSHGANISAGFSFFIIENVDDIPIVAMRVPHEPGACVRLADTCCTRASQFLNDTARESIMRKVCQLFGLKRSCPRQSFIYQTSFLT